MLLQGFSYENYACFRFFPLLYCDTFKNTPFWNQMTHLYKKMSHHSRKNTFYCYSTPALRELLSIILWFTITRDVPSITVLSEIHSSKCIVILFFVNIKKYTHWQRFNVSLWKQCNYNSHWQEMCFKRTNCINILKTTFIDNITEFARHYVREYRENMWIAVRH